MKFLEAHRKEIYNSMAEFGFQQDDFSYVKRRGRIHIQYEPADTYFAYLRKKETRLDPETKQWAHHEYYKVHIKNNKETDQSWENLIKHFRKWLESL